MEQVAEVLQLPNNRPKSRKSNKNAWKKTISKNNKARGKYFKFSKHFADPIYF